MHRECAPDVGDLYRVPSRHRCRIGNRSIVHFTFDGQLVGQPPEHEPFTAATVFHAPHQVSWNHNRWKERRRCQQALQEYVLRVYWAIPGLFRLSARSSA
jgi:hypothetical protein